MNTTTFYKLQRDTMAWHIAYWLAETGIYHLFEIVMQSLTQISDNPKPPQPQKSEMLELLKDTELRSPHGFTHYTVT